MEVDHPEGQQPPQEEEALDLEVGVGGAAP